MSIFNNTEGDPRKLSLHGPVLQVYVEVPTATAGTLDITQQPIPGPIHGLALIDTGASISAIQKDVAEELGLQSSGVREIITRTRKSRYRCFQLEFLSRAPRLRQLGLPRVAGVNLPRQATGTSLHLIMLVGRDILKDFLFAYNGTTGRWSVAQQESSCVIARHQIRASAAFFSATLFPARLVRRKRCQILD